MRFGKWIAACAAMALTSCANNVPKTADELTITNVKAGLMHKADGVWEVYEQGELFQYKRNGECVANGVHKPCMWHGTTFDYVASRAGQELECVLTRNRPQNQVNPRAELGVSTGGKYLLRLPKAKGTYVGVGYQTPKNELPGTAAQRTVCSFGGRTLFEVNFAVIFTEADIANAI
jgi:hypothetical protein